MSSAQILRYLIIAMWATALLGVVLDFSLDSQLPETLRDYRAAEWDSDFTARDGLGAVAGLVVIWYMVRGSIQLYRLRFAGRRTFLIGVVLGALTMPVYGPDVYHGWTSLFNEASTTLGGVIVGWLYLSDIQLQLKDAASAEGPSPRPPPIS